MRSAMVLLTMAACGGGKAPEAPRPAPAPLPGYASADPITSVRVFAPGVVSTAAPEFATAFARDGQAVYFDRANDDRSKLAIVASTFANGAWQPAAPLAFSTGEFRDVDPFVAGDRLYFSSNRPRPGSPDRDFDTWYVVRTGETWSEPVHVDGAPSGPGNQVCVSIARDGTLYFQSDASGGGDIYRAARVGDGYPTAAPVAEITTAASESNPAISPDGTLLVFVSDREGGQGGADLYASRAHGGAWSAARNLGPAINSPFADFAPAFSPDGKYLFFTSERPGIVPTPESGARPPGDLYQIEVAALGI
jgi:Tol biopolymer transport system component